MMTVPVIVWQNSRAKEEEVVSPPKSKGKGKAWIQEVDQGEVTGVVCNLCDKKGIPCRWGKVSNLFSYFY